MVKQSRGTRFVNQPMKVRHVDSRGKSGQAQRYKAPRHKDGPIRALCSHDDVEGSAAIREHFTTLPTEIQRYLTEQLLYTPRHNTILYSKVAIFMVLVA